MQIVAIIGLGLLGLWAARRIYLADRRLQELHKRDYEPEVWLHLWVICYGTKLFYLAVATIIVVGLLYASHVYH